MTAALARPALSLGLSFLAVLPGGLTVPAGAGIPPPPKIEGETVEIALSPEGEAGDTTSGPCIPVDRIIVDGVALLPAQAIRAALAARAKACVGNEVARAIVGALNDLYAGEGYVTTQAYVPQQDLKATRTLRVDIVAGRVGRIDYRESEADGTLGEAWDDLRNAAGPWDAAKKTSALLATLDNGLDRFQLLPPSTADGLKARLALPLDPGDVVQIDRLQQGIDQLNRTPSQRANAKLEPGDEPGTSTVVVANPRADSFRVFAGYELNGNTLNGNRTLPSDRARLDLFKDNLIGLNDAWATSYAGGLDSNELRAGMSVPVRWLTLSLDGGYSEYLAPIGRYADLFTQLYTGGLTAGIMISRDKVQQTTVDTGLHWRRLDRFIDDLSLGAQTVTFVRGAVTHQRFFEDAQLVTSLGLSHGLATLSAIRDPFDPPADLPRAQFLKLDGLLSYARAIEGAVTARFELAGQWAGTPLYADDQLILGSVSTVRGFTRMPFRTDRGAYARGELAAGLPMGLVLGDQRGDLVFLDEVGSAIQLYAFATLGGGRDIAAKVEAARGSIGGGVRYKQGRFNIDLTVAKPVYQTGLPISRDTYKPELYLTASAQLF